MCWPAMLIVLTSVFSLGLCLGKFWEKYSLLQEGQRQSLKVRVRTGPKHNDEGGCGAEEPFGEPEGESDIAVYFTKYGTKVHLFRCQALNSTDFEKMKKTTLCKHCMKNRRLSVLKSD